MRRPNAAGTLPRTGAGARARDAIDVAGYRSALEDQMNEHRVGRTEPAGYGLRLLTFDRSLAGHALPGQFTTATLPDGRRAFFALANDPGAPVELLIKLQGEVADALVATPIGEVVSLSPAMGRGFGVPEALAPLVLLIAGSGLSAVRAMIRAELAAGLPRPVHLRLGVLTLDHVPFAADVEAWAQAGVDVRLVLGTPPPGWTGASGFVQHVARDEGLIRAGHHLVVCGFGEMVDEVRAMAEAAGAGPVYTNY
jgi:CDP-4-dehydro-6-deoxyglucose reductase